jgi:hypothetical protein
MFHELGTSDPSSRASRYAPGQVTSLTTKGPSRIGDNLCRSMVVCILRSTRSPTAKLHALMFREWKRLIACWYIADWMTAASRSSSSWSRSVRRDSLACCSLNFWVRNDRCSPQSAAFLLIHRPRKNETARWPDWDLFAEPIELMAVL